MSTNPKISFNKGTTQTRVIVVRQPDPAHSGQFIPVDVTGSVVFLSVRRHVGDSNYILKKTCTILDGPNGRVQVDFLPTDTFDIASGALVFDVMVNFAGGSKAIPIPRGDFILGEDVTQPIPTSVDPALMSTATCRFIRPDGVPYQQKVLISALDVVASTGTFLVTPGMTMAYESDSSGLLEFSLLRNLRVRVALEGTTFIREFVVPDAATFDLLTVMAAAPDMFTVQTPAPLMIRRNI